MAISREKKSNIIKIQNMNFFLVIHIQFNMRSKLRRTKEKCNRDIPSGWRGNGEKEKSHKRKIAPLYIMLRVRSRSTEKLDREKNCNVARIVNKCYKVYLQSFHVASHKIPHLLLSFFLVNYI